MEKIILAIYDLLGEEKRKGENDPKQSTYHKKFNFLTIFFETKYTQYIFT